MIYFNPQGSREPRPATKLPDITVFRFQSTRLSRASTLSGQVKTNNPYISIHKALASLDKEEIKDIRRRIQFQSTRLSRASTGKASSVSAVDEISIHKALASLDDGAVSKAPDDMFISIHKALASLDKGNPEYALRQKDFNPQGSREPRPRLPSGISSGTEFQSTRLSRASTWEAACSFVTPWLFQSTRLSRASTLLKDIDSDCLNDFNPQGSREPRRV